MHRLIEHNSKLITELHKRVHEEHRKHPQGPCHIVACQAFHDSYDALAFPGGYADGLLKLENGDPGAIDAALAFLEVRPYFFRSQYMMKKLMRLLRRAPLSARQSERFETIFAHRILRKRSTRAEPAHGPR